MHICTHTVQAETTAAALWQLWTNVKHWPSWDTRLQSVEMNTPFRQGNSGMLTFKDGTQRKFTVIKLQMLEGIVILMPYQHNSELRIAWDIKSTDGGAVTFEQEVTLTASPFSMLLLRGQKEMLVQQATEQLQKMVQMLEGATSPFQDTAGRGSPKTAL